jgi:hypothetical protein
MVVIILEIVGKKAVKKSKYMTQQQFKIHTKTKVIFMEGRKRKILFPYNIKKVRYLCLV